MFAILFSDSIPPLRYW